MADVFISYKREDRAGAERVAAALQALGYSTWWDSSVHAGDYWDIVIERELHAATCVLVLWSQRSILSRWVREEANYAAEKESLVAASLDGTLPPFGFKMIQAPNLTHWTGQAEDANWSLVLRGIEARCGARVTPAPARAGPPAPQSRSKSLPNPPAARPDWASEAGEDRFGRWADIRLGNARQRLRWIEPGRFWMGSPEDEPGRMDHEGPRHQVTLTSGFWLFDTPVTQALWQAVMGDYPSRFTGADRPVEQVSWEDVQHFLERINGRMPGLDLALPTEAQWEYACRAGTTTATYAGPMEILSSDNAPVLDAIAWYRGNSGNETHPVGQKAPNSWGLYDMLGNVLEWCADDMRPYGPGPATDPAGAHSSAERPTWRAVRGGSWSNAAWYVRAANRGGSWSSDAGGVRAAYRDAHSPGLRYFYLGFRCARGRP